MNHKITLISDYDSERTYKTIVEEVHEGTAIIDKEGILLFANSNFGRLIGMRPEEVLGHHILDFIAPDSVYVITEAIKTAFCSNQQRRVQVLTSGQNSIALLLSLHPLALSDKQVISMIVTDLTSQIKYTEEIRQKGEELKLKNAELIKINNELSTFLYVSSHDLQEPLRKIQLFLNLILDEESHELSRVGRDYLDRVLKTTRKMQSLLCDLVLYSDIKREDLVFEETTLKEITDDVMIEFEECLKQRNIRILVKEMPTIIVVRTQFRQLLLNLLANAIQFCNSNQQPLIIISHTKVHGKGIKGLDANITYDRITVSDNGVGFDNTYCEKIFELFQRLNGNEENSGTGIGLPLCKRIVENHRGIITASGEPGNGAYFHVYLPSDRAVIKVTSNKT